jgi:Flp pilus assembly protein TadG
MPDVTIRNTMRRFARREEGQAMVEFAIVLPVLLLIVLGIIQFGMLFKNYIALTDAVRVGARQAAVSRTLPNPEQVAIARVQRAAVGLDTNRLVVTVDPYDPVSGTRTWVQSGDVEVRATYPYSINLLGITVMSGVITSRTIERVE